MFFIGVVYSLVAAFLSYWVFRSFTSVVMVTFTAIAAIPFVNGANQSEENRDVNWKDATLIQKHGRILGILTFLFLGFVTTFLALYLLLPVDMSSQMFSAQTETISSIRAMPTGHFISQAGLLGKILVNNLRILLFCLFFSFFYGAGAIFILSWNASVMGTAIGSAINQGLASGTKAPLHIFLTSILGYFAHGLPEIIAYFIAGLAGGIFSVAMMTETFGDQSFRRVAVDCLNLFGFALFVLLLAGIIEVFVSPTILWG